ncbi:TetR/AcrR family transcriptional regulator [Stakelama tenebrarum]|uniref:TetR/AcrR family transcriptional regulator n=1 Tax=Stakelama tenebrarum TaxID=2711215 RepID=A0A6G6Y852_9SPHN|nr:TetR/AcrR family transcriptional regulator [Sphingosinithalassobacter tenebrarum]QIG81105.1 TetR/AcrR family transcriptional regulator [Sphingosinithalassobacter tenebrarum]
MVMRKFLLEDPARPAKTSDNKATRERIVDALMALTAEGAVINHDLVAERAGVSRRTAYRYFPDQEALRSAVLQRMNNVSASPRSLDALLDGLESRFGDYDAHADAMMVLTTTAEGRTTRNMAKPERVTAYRAMLGDATAYLPEPDRRWAIAAIQLMGSDFAWREMRDQWDMDGEESAAAVRWAIETLLADLERRGNKPLSEGPVAASEAA